MYYIVYYTLLLLLVVESTKQQNNYFFLCNDNKIVQTIDVNIYAKEKHNITNVFYDDKLVAKFKYDKNIEEIYLYFENDYITMSSIKNNCNLLPTILSFYSDDFYKTLQYRYFQQLNMEKIYYNDIGYYSTLSKYNNNWNITMLYCNQQSDSRNFIFPFIATIVIDKIC